jgi:hypothetical protein
MVSVMKPGQLTLIERSLRALRIATVIIVAAGAAAYSPLLAGYVGPGTATGDAVGAAASWVVAQVAAVWDETLGALPAQGSAPAAGAPMVLTPPAKPATSAAVKPATPPKAASASTPAASKPAAAAAAEPASVGAIPPASGAAASQAAAAAAAPNLSQGELALVVSLLRNTLVALNQANMTGNYTVLRDLGAPGFREVNNATRLAEIFAPVRALNVDLSPVVLLDPRLTVAKVNDNGMLNVAGSLPTQPVGVNFELLYQRVQNSWQLFGVSISTDATVAAAPKPAGAPAATPASAPAAPAPTTPTAAAAPRGTTPPKP